MVDDGTSLAEALLGSVGPPALDGRGRQGDGLITVDPLAQPVRLFRLRRAGRGPGPEAPASETEEDRRTIRETSANDEGSDHSKHYRHTPNYWAQHLDSGRLTSVTGRSVK